MAHVSRGKALTHFNRAGFETFMMLVAVLKRLGPPKTCLIPPTTSNSLARTNRPLCCFLTLRSSFEDFHSARTQCRKIYARSHLALSLAARPLFALPLPLCQHQPQHRAMSVAKDAPLEWELVDIENEKELNFILGQARWLAFVLATETSRAPVVEPELPTVPCPHHPRSRKSKNFSVSHFYLPTGPLYQDSGGPVRDLLPGRAHCCTGTLPCCSTFCTSCIMPPACRPPPWADSSLAWPSARHRANARCAGSWGRCGAFLCS